MKFTKNVKFTEDERGHFNMEWQSMEGFLEDLREMKARGAVMHADYHSSARESVNWYGCEGGCSGFFSKLANGWPELRATLERMMRGIELELPSFPTRTTVRCRKRRRDDHGDELDITRVWNGQLDTAWSHAKRTEKVRPNTKRITIAIDVGTSCAVSAEEALWRAALALTLCDSLAKSGKVFEVWATYTAQAVWRGHHGKELNGAFCIKRSGDPLVLDRLCSMVCAGFHRAVGFWSFHAAPWQVESYYGLYRSRHLPVELWKRRQAEEVVLHIERCFSKSAMIENYRKAWEEVEAASLGQVQEVA